MPPAPRRPWWQRALAFCLAVWFVAVAMDLPALHACAMHGGGGSHGVGHAGSTEHGMAMAMAPHAHATSGGSVSAAVDHGPSLDAADAASRHAPSPASGGHACSCLGHCCGAAHTAPPSVAVLLAAAFEETPVAPGRPQYEYVAAWVDFVLPFATAPPARG